ncbi:MAG: class I SAM-dependent methyltransferase [candidate division Zixibacteria bacterium]|nr:class I SAM-dependent methyltransferase [candidate division Zixibacteria bacterium]
MKKESGWWYDFFPAFRGIFNAIPQKQTNAQVRYILRKLDLRPGKKFLDCPCGIGRIALPMAKQRIRVTGIDIMPSYIDEFREKAKRRGLKVNLFVNDMRRINFKNEFHAAANIWTSFGFFEKESDNRLVLKKLHQALMRGGKAMLYLINRDWVVSNFRKQEWFISGDIKVLEQRNFEYETSKMKGSWSFIKDGAEETHNMNLRLYSCHELFDMFRSIGFADIRGYGSIKDEPITRESSRMYIVGTKK